MLSKEEIVIWISHPVTQEMLKFLAEDKVRLEENLKEYMMTCQTAKDMEIGFLRGHIAAAEAFMKLKDKMLMFSEEEKEDAEIREREKEAKISSFRA